MHVSLAICERKSTFSWQKKLRKPLFSACTIISYCTFIWCIGKCDNCGKYYNRDLRNSIARSECITDSEQKKLESMQEEVGKVDRLFRKFCSLGREEEEEDQEEKDEK